ncbi:RING-H2 finger protein ATL56-like [Typha angustifolia]|uniref:RING-H2 finger protein ATL56-like n=1 Tax=Typha angustifolia TaxID=59011 RepID=UPI003C2DD27F
MARCDDDRPISSPAAVAPPPPKTKCGGERLLSFVLQSLVMAVALALFFLFAGVAALVLLHLCVAGRALRRRRLSDDDVGEPLPGLSPDEIRDLPCFEYDSPGCAPHPPPPDCAVCLEGFREMELCRALARCGHVFHAACVDRWLVRSPKCPICRAGVAEVEKI